ncbi:cyclopropane-fatty-acyl-phospholipid synthase [Pseudaminobacter salicylatoxidans]|uniref:Cyclopropane-fatty-acyl-phospholipid synthase n=1 Tax=Pseudaminobacter salicylatoxidans TaxID=93369 RepID=A0A316C650_PSESE|nr:cyclopropane-fatty-acyl-phospholipid synthase family protein [Pseudaminobacter salicylatoxidans]PWJ85225.1 cyclopropane-fatty-acyl-phospholipid synthase [Pseudaminobacter salicylatoxidans]
MNILLQRIVERLVRTGNLTITSANGSSRSFGDGTGDPVHVVFRTGHAERAVAMDPMLALPEAFMDGEIDIVEGDVLGLLHTAYQNMGPGGVEAAWTKALEGLRHAFRRLQQLNTTSRSRRNVQRHYDLSGEMYKLFLDEDMQYSCAYFERPDMTLDEAQLAKKRHIAAKMQMKPGLSVLDIGSGWGGLGLYLARNFEADVLGVTLSTEQHTVSTDRAHAEGLQNHVHFELRDYRHLTERFDRIVSVGMFEHVGVNHYRAFFEKCATLLKPDGVMVLHSIGRNGPPYATNAFIRKYIFPGGYIPALSEVLPVIEKSGLMVTDIEILRLHYAETLKHWRERFMANRDKAKAIYDERFCRMWEFYLAGSEASFRWQEMMNFQIQLTRRNDVLPITRDYMAEAEQALAMQDNQTTAEQQDAAAAQKGKKRISEAGE